MPPWLLRVEVDDVGSRPVRVWVPLVVLWVLGLPLLAAALAASAVTGALGVRVRHVRLTPRLVLACVHVVSATRGTRVGVDAPGSRVRVVIA